jgi:serine/threonine-protein kinase HipA
MSRLLKVYLHDVYAGKLVQKDSGRLSFTYDKAYVNENGFSISLSLPLQYEPFDDDRVKAFFSGLLPDETVKNRLAKYLGVSPKNPFSLLEAVGGECAGALSLYPEGVAPEETRAERTEILEDEKLQELLLLLKRRPFLAGNDGLRLSLAGAQDKMAVHVCNGKIALSQGMPTTHILKPLIDTVKDSVHNELFCMRLAQMVGIDVPPADIHFVKGIPYFLVERYDRIRTVDNKIVRLHQEDFCQALGIMPEIKYEREGGPSIMKCQKLLQQFSIKPASDQISLLERVIFNYLIGNADAHGKNFSLLYKAKKPQLAPAYDLLSTAIYPDLSKNMAMKIGGKYIPEDVFLRTWHQLVPNTKMSQKNMEKQLIKLSKRVVEQAFALKTTLQESGISSCVFEAICGVIYTRSKQIERG